MLNQEGVDPANHTGTECVADAARKVSWNNMGDEPVYQEGPGC